MHGQKNIQLLCNSLDFLSPFIDSVYLNALNGAGVTKTIYWLDWEPHGQGLGLIPGCN